MKKDQTIFEVVKRFNTEARSASRIRSAFAGRMDWNVPTAKASAS
jgi:hypothetical protein